MDISIINKTMNLILSIKVMLMMVRARINSSIVCQSSRLKIVHSTFSCWQRVKTVFCQLLMKVMLILNWRIMQFRRVRLRNRKHKQTLIIHYDLIHFLENIPMTKLKYGKRWRTVNFWNILRIRMNFRTNISWIKFNPRILRHQIN